MTFEENDWRIEYRLNRPPDVSCTGVNIEVLCVDKVITFRKYPTGILLHREQCACAGPEACNRCTHDIDVGGKTLWATDFQKTLMKTLGILPGYLTGDKNDK